VNEKQGDEVSKKQGEKVKEAGGATHSVFFAGGATTTQTS
jgi:hypothetical protein